MVVEETRIPGLLVVGAGAAVDERGWFREVVRVGELSAASGVPPEFRQVNHAHTAAGGLRGFHAEPWSKLVYVVRGTAFCAIADVRVDSPTFGATETFLLGDPPGSAAALFLADGLANAYCAVTDVDYVYLVTAEWSPDADKRAVAWDDPDLAVAWPVTDPVLSPADAANPTLRERFGDHPRLHRPT